MADQFLGIQAFSGTPTLIGASTKAPAGAKSGDGGEFPEVLVQACLGGAAQASTVDRNKDAKGEKGKDEQSDGNQAEESTALLAGSVIVQLPMMATNADGALTDPPQGGSGESETGGSLKMLASQGTTPVMEAALALMEPVKPEPVESASLLGYQDVSKGKAIAPAVQGAQLLQAQEVRPVYKLLRDIALGIFSAGSPAGDGMQADSIGENLAALQSGQKMLASEIAQNVLSSVEKVKKEPSSQQIIPDPEFKPSVLSEMSRVVGSGERQESSPAGTLRDQISTETLRTANQPFGITGTEQAGLQPGIEENRSADSAPAQTVGEPIHKVGELPRQQNTEARTGSVEQGTKHGESPALPQGTGVNASAAEREASDSLFGRNMANAFHQQGTESTTAGISGKELTGGTGSAGLLLTPELSQSVIEQVAKGLALQVQGKVSEMRLTLKPETLGEMAVKVRVEDGKMQAQIDVSQPAVKAVVESNLPQLRQALSDSGIEVQRIDVFATAQDAARESNGSRGEKPRHRGGRRGGTVVEATEPNPATRMMGYNTMEIII